MVCLAVAISVSFLLFDNGLLTHLEISSAQLPSFLSVHSTGTLLCGQFVSWDGRETLLLPPSNTHPMLSLERYPDTPLLSLSSAHSDPAAGPHVLLRLLRQ